LALINLSETKPKQMSNQASELTELSAKYEHLLALLRERDSLMLDYAAALSYSNEQYGEWNRVNWKTYARNQLALIQAVRPVTYADYRVRIKILSPTFGLEMPYLKVTGWMLNSEAELRREAEQSASLLALFGDKSTSEALLLPALPPVVEELLTAVPVEDAVQLSAIELRKRNRAKLRTHVPDLVDALKNSFLSSNPITFDE
jgi:hypothetical protein